MTVSGGPKKGSSGPKKGSQFHFALRNFWFFLMAQSGSLDSESVTAHKGFLIRNS